jgi:toxin-antitoxin system PIN domain toxin
MKLVDANVLLYAVNEDSPHHREARLWLERVLSGTEAIGFAMIVVLAFLRLSTNPAASPRPLTIDQAVGAVAGWLRQPTATIPDPGDEHVALLHRLLEPLGGGGNLVNDAHLAALALEHGAEVVSYDADFARFAGVRWRSPAARG